MSSGDAQTVAAPAEVQESGDMPFLSLTDESFVRLQGALRDAGHLEFVVQAADPERGTEEVLFVAPASLGALRLRRDAPLDAPPVMEMD